MQKKIFAALVFFLICLAPAQVWAAQDTTVIIDNAIVRAEPRDNAKIVEYLNQGNEIRISNYPLEGGWYKVRSKGGAYGWVHESYLSVTKSAESVDDGTTEQLEMSEAEIHKQVPKPEIDRRWFVRSHYGFHFQSAADINDIFTFTEFNLVNYFGMEAGYFVKPKIAFLLRADYIYKDLVAKESTSSITYNMGLRSLPIMVGAEYYLIKLPPLRLSVGAFAGLAFATQFSVQAISKPTPNTFLFEDRPFTTLIRANLTRPLGRLFSVFIEGGYRYLVTKEIATTSASAMQGGQVFLKNGLYQSRILDLSGFDIGAGLGVHF